MASKRVQLLRDTGSYKGYERFGDWYDDRIQDESRPAGTNARFVFIGDATLGRYTTLGKSFPAFKTENALRSCIVSSLV